MDFAKGALIGMVAGALVGVMNSSNLVGMYKKGKKELMKMKKKILPQV